MADSQLPLISDPELSRKEFQEWVRTVRDPASRTDEGSRTIAVLQRAAWAGYRIAPLPNGAWAIQIDCVYRCGDCRGLGTPWKEFPSREEALDHFLLVARRHFSGKLDGESSQLQQQAQQEMLHQLRGGLFGFLEPALDSPEPRSPNHHESETENEDEFELPQTESEESGTAGQSARS